MTNLERLTKNNQDIQSCIDKANNLPDVGKENNDEMWLIKEFSTYTNSNVTKLGQGAFAFCQHLTAIDLPSCEILGSMAFHACKGLTTVSFPKCTRIEDYGLRECSNLREAYFPECATIAYGFISCNKLVSVYLPKCSYLGYMTFARCYSLPSLDLPKMATIGSSCFINCSSLMSLTLGGSSVVKLSNTNAFASSPMSISSLTGSFGSIYVPASLVDAYKSATNWATYAARITAI